MNHSDEEYFEAMDRQLDLETVNFVAYPAQSIANRQQAKETIQWKYTPVSSPQPKTATYSPSKRYARNISFEDEQVSYSQEESEEDEDQPVESPFLGYYRDAELVYKKKFSWGTSWIGRRQYYSSVFMDPQRIDRASLPYYTPDTPPTSDEVDSSKQCSFDSDFESGNLYAVYKVGALEYDLILQNDINTKGNTQWFYFRINNPPRRKAIKINIVNMRKNDSLFNYGMLPCVFSLSEYHNNKKGWGRAGRNVSYFRNNHPIENSKRYFYTLSFTISTPHEGDVLRVSQAYPYTTTDLNNYLDGIEKIKYKKELMERETIVNTIGKNKIEVLTIKQANNRVKKRPIIFVMARQHPGQTPGSYVLEGILDSLLSKQKDSEYLRKHFEIKVVPMVNPDGVCAGNYRTNLYGFDLNRRWEGGRNKNLHEAAYIKKYMSTIFKGREVAFILDLHGHSRKLYSFFYGNSSASSPLQIRMFPMMCSKLSPHCIRYEDSTFALEEQKRNTARIQCHLSFKCLNIFTYETSFFGYVGKDKEKRHFTMDGFRQLGGALVRAMYLHERGRESQITKIEHKDAALFKKCLKELKNNGHLSTFGQGQNSGSESSPQECQVKEVEAEKLQTTDGYLKLSPSPGRGVKIVKKIVRKDMMVKESAKSTRQMQIYDVAQVHSMIPHNVLALIPSSFLTRKAKQKQEAEVQTDNCSLMRVYQACKDEEHKQQQIVMSTNPDMVRSMALSPDKKIKPNGARPNMLKSTTLTSARPYTSRMDRELPTRGSSVTQRKDKAREYKPRTSQYRNTHKKTVSQSMTRTFQRGVQTSLTFNIGSTLVRTLDRQAQILQSKTIDPAYSSVKLHQRTFGEAMSPSKVLTRNVLENIKLRRRNVSEQPQ